MISCSEYDYIEIVCLYRYPVQLLLRSGETIKGIALDTKRNDNKAECIELNVNDKKQLIELDELVKLTVTEDNPHFTEVTFNQ